MNVTTRSRGTVTGMTSMDTKIPTMLWKTQLLRLLSEAPKALCVECTDLGYARFPSSSSTTSGDDADSDQSNQSLGSVSLNEFSLSKGHQQQNHNQLEKIMEKKSCTLSPEDKRLLDSLAELEIQIQMVDSSSVVSCSNSPSPSSSNGSSSNNPPEVNVPDGSNGGGLVVLRADVGGESVSESVKGKTAAAPWHRPSIYLFNPFGNAFHGYLSHSNVHRLLRDNGNYLIRKREKDHDDEFILSFRFNNHIKNFVISFDDTSGLIYVGDREKGFEKLDELVQEGLTTMYLEQKAGSYIDLMCDLTRYPSRHPHHHIEGNNENPLKPLQQHNPPPLLLPFNNNYKKQSSPSPSLSSSSLGRSSIERGRRPELKSHAFELHTFQELSKCQSCRNFLWGLSSQGLFCKHCSLAIHESCLARITSDCEPSLSSLSCILGTELTILVKASGASVPFLLKKTMLEIESRGLALEGIYRVSGSRELTERLKILFETDRERADISGHIDIHSMCGLVKLFLRNLPQPLITKEIFQRFLNLCNNPPMDKNNGIGNGPAPLITVELVRRELKRLPPAHYITLKALLQHLHTVAEHSDRNKMNPFNLASVFTPSVLSPSQINMDTLKTATSLLELMIVQVRNLYPR